MPGACTAAVFEEVPEPILRALDEAFAAKPFGVLVMDHVSSQTGRILPLDDVLAWCRGHRILSVVDGTQRMTFGSNWTEY